MGGDFPRWCGDGEELFFLSGEKMMAAAVGTRSPYDVSRDGERFLTNVWDRDPGTTPITCVVNWHRGR